MKRRLGRIFHERAAQVVIIIRVRNASDDGQRLQLENGVRKTIMIIICTAENLALWKPTTAFRFVMRAISCVADRCRNACRGWSLMENMVVRAPDERATRRYFLSRDCGMLLFNLCIFFFFLFSFRHSYATWTIIIDVSGKNIEKKKTVVFNMSAGTWFLGNMSDPEAYRSNVRMSVDLATREHQNTYGRVFRNWGNVANLVSRKLV